MLGQIEIIEQPAMTDMPQKAASAWSAMNDLIGAAYTPFAFVASQLAKGTNYFFLANQFIQQRHIVLVTINEFNGIFKLVDVKCIL